MVKFINMHKISVIVVRTHLGTSSANHSDLCRSWTTTCFKACCFNTTLFITTFCGCLYVYVHILCRIHWSFKTDNNKKVTVRRALARSYTCSLVNSLSQMNWVRRCRQVLKKDNTFYVPLRFFVSSRKLNENNEGKHLIVQSNLWVFTCARACRFIFFFFFVSHFFALLTQIPWNNSII